MKKAKDRAFFQISILNHKNWTGKLPLPKPVEFILNQDNFRKSMNVSLNLIEIRYILKLHEVISEKFDRG